mgnify:CR=1 FL=1
MGQRRAADAKPVRPAPHLASPVSHLTHVSNVAVVRQAAARAPQLPVLPPQQAVLLRQARRRRHGRRRRRHRRLPGRRWRRPGRRRHGRRRRGQRRLRLRCRRPWGGRWRPTGGRQRRGRQRWSGRQRRPPPPPPPLSLHGWRWLRCWWQQGGGRRPTRRLLRGRPRQWRRRLQELGRCCLAAERAGRRCRRGVAGEARPRGTKPWGAILYSIAAVAVDAAAGLQDPGRQQRRGWIARRGAWWRRRPSAGAAHAEVGGAVGGGGATVALHAGGGLVEKVCGTAMVVVFRCPFCLMIAGSNRGRSPSCCSRRWGRCSPGLHSECHTFQLHTFGESQKGPGMSKPGMAAGRPSAVSKYARREHRQRRHPCGTLRVGCHCRQHQCQCHRRDHAQRLRLVRGEGVMDERTGAGTERRRACS